MRKVYVLSLFVLLICVTLALIDRGLRRRGTGGATAVRVLLGLAVLAVYVYGVLSLTVLGREAGEVRQAELELFWSHREALAYVDGELSVTNAAILEEILLNVVMFVPLGALLPFVFRRSLHECGFISGAFVVTVFGACCSAAIELVQWRWRLGVFDFNDILDNAIGALVGYVVFRMFSSRW